MSILNVHQTLAARCFESHQLDGFGSVDSRGATQSRSTLSTTTLAGQAGWTKVNQVVQPAQTVAPTDAEALSDGETATATTDAKSDIVHLTDQGVSPCKTQSRQDPFTGRWTIFAAERGERPTDFIWRPPVTNTTFNCPFCAGHEAQTPESVLTFRRNEILNAIRLDDVLPVQQSESDDAASCDDWAIRVFPNKFPAVDRVDEPTDIEFAASTHSERTTSLFRSRRIVGGHEVIIESPDHGESLVSIDLPIATMVFRAYQLRMQHWRRNRAIQYISLFKNSGDSAGASLRHAHAQLLATSELPPIVANTAARVKYHWAKTGCCMQCETVRAEQKIKDRIVASTKSLVAYCPFASPLPMLLKITSREHVGCFEELTIQQLEELAILVRNGIRWLESIYPQVAYNFVIHTRPPAVGDETPFHWSLELFPRITKIAGFEWSSDCIINPMMPETAAARFRAKAKEEFPLG